MKFAYADPPYLGCAKFYSEHPDAWVWDEMESHLNLIAKLCEYDGWAYSCNSKDLKWLIPELLTFDQDIDYRIASWVKPFAAFKKNVRIAYTWEPVLFKPGRDSSKMGAPVGRDHLSEPITLKRGLTGAKPARFNRWVLDLLGYIDGDDVDDLFPGTGGMAAELAAGVLL